MLARFNETRLIGILSMYAYVVGCYKIIIIVVLLCKLSPSFAFFQCIYKLRLLGAQLRFPYTYTIYSHSLRNPIININWIKFLLHVIHKQINNIFEDKWYLSPFTESPGSAREREKCLCWATGTFQLFKRIPLLLL